MTLPLSLACSACSDALFAASSWLASATPTALVGFLLEGALFTIACVALRTPPQRSRASGFAVALGVCVLSVLAGGGLLLGSTVASAMLAVGLLRSLYAERSAKRPLSVARVTAVGVTAAFALWMAAPRHRSTRELIDTAAAVVHFQQRDGWLFDELHHRSDALAELNADLARDSEPHLRLHALLGGPEAARQSACVRLRLTPCP